MSFSFGTTNQSTQQTGFGTTQVSGGSSSFVQPQQSASFGGFGTGGSIPTFGSNTLGQPSGFNSLSSQKPNTTGFGLSNSLSTGASAPIGFGSTTSSQVSFNSLQQQQQTQIELAANSRYEALPGIAKSEIDRTYAQMKQPMRETIESVSRIRGNIFKDVRDELHFIHLSVLRVHNKQQEMQNEIIPFLDELKEMTKISHQHANISLEQIKNNDLYFRAGNKVSSGLSLPGTIHNRGVNRLDESLPSKWHLKLVERLEQRLQDCIVGVRSFERQLSVRMKALGLYFTESQDGAFMSDGDRTRALKAFTNRGQYGQLQQVGPKQLLDILRDQARGFLAVARTVAEVHREVNILREATIHLMRTGNSFSSQTIGDPFAIADRQEAAQRRMLEQRVIGESNQFLIDRNAVSALLKSSGHPTNTALQQSQGTASTLAANTAATEQAANSNSQTVSNSLAGFGQSGISTNIGAAFGQQQAPSIPAGSFGAANPGVGNAVTSFGSAGINNPQNSQFSFGASSAGTGFGSSFPSVGTSSKKQMKKK